MTFETQLHYIERTLEVYPQLVHASNIITKFKSGTGKEKEALEALISEYYSYLISHMSIKGWDKKAIVKKVELLNCYYDYYDNNTSYNYAKLFSSQGKLRPTILEEFCFFLFKDYLRSLKSKIADSSNTLNLGSAKAYTNLYFSPESINGFVNDPSVVINVKDQDFAIYRTVGFRIDGKKEAIAKVPILAIEVKTYLDKTMLEGVISTAEKLKLGNPYSRIIVVSESYQVDLSVDPSYSQIDQIYVLRKCGNIKRIITKGENVPPIYEDVVIRLFEEAKYHIERPWSDVSTKLEEDGIIL